MPEVDRLKKSQLLMNLYSLAQSSVSMQVKDWAEVYSFGSCTFSGDPAVNPSQNGTAKGYIWAKALFGGPKMRAKLLIAAITVVSLAGSILGFSPAYANEDWQRSIDSPIPEGS